MEAVAKPYEAGELVDASTLDPKKLQQTVWFFITLYYGRRGRENQRQLTKNKAKAFSGADMYWNCSLPVKSTKFGEKVVLNVVMKI